MRKILAPHKEQDGYVYARLRKAGLDKFGNLKLLGWFKQKYSGWSHEWQVYFDDNPDQRIISSKRVEEAVETMDYLKRCAEEGLRVERYRTTMGPHYWRVKAENQDNYAFACRAATLREAYHRYHASHDPR